MKHRFQVSKVKLVVLEGNCFFPAATCFSNENKERDSKSERFGASTPLSSIAAPT
jgi:hypothetical protein